jgi:hypothetical protein
MNSYELSRRFWDWAFDNPEKVKPIHAAIYFFAVEHCNRLGWKEKFGLPSQMVMEAVGVKNWRTYSAGLNDLVDYDFILMIETSKNQYSANIIAIVNFTKAPTKALDKALSKHLQKQGTKHSQSTVSIDKQLNKEPITIKQGIEKRKKFTPPSIDDVFNYCLERSNEVDSNKFINFYESKDWMIGKNKMKDWKAAVRTWEGRKEKSSEQKEKSAWDQFSELNAKIQNQ